MTDSGAVGAGNVGSIADHSSALRRVCVDAGFVYRAVDPLALDGGEAGAFLTHLDLADSQVFRSGLVDLELWDLASSGSSDLTDRDGEPHLGRCRWQSRCGRL
jgi:hypothetical protein